MATRFLNYSIGFCGFQFIPLQYAHSLFRKFTKLLKKRLRIGKKAGLFSLFYAKFSFEYQRTATLNYAKRRIFSFVDIDKSLTVDTLPPQWKYGVQLAGETFLTLLYRNRNGRLGPPGQALLSMRVPHSRCGQNGKFAAAACFFCILWYQPHITDF